LSETSRIHWQSKEKSGCHLKRTGNVIETLPLEEAPEAYTRMMDGKAGFRLMLVNGKG
jgi:hypothetical protein